MIKVKVYGYLRGALGKAEFEVDKSETKVKDILNLISSQNDELNLSHLSMLILINGVEISNLNRVDTIVRSGDEITLVPITHGG